MPTLLLTDILIFLLLLMAVGFVFYVRTKPHLITPWREIGKSRVAMGAAVVLSFYVMVGLLDSIHYKPVLDVENSSEKVYSNEILSVFDWLVSDLRNQDEKTYSAPFATQLYAKETVQTAGGVKQRVYPRLIYGGAHLDNNASKSSDIISLSAVGFIKGAVLWCGIVLGFGFFYARRADLSFKESLYRIFARKTEFEWRSALITLGMVLTLLAMSFELAGKYHIFGTDKVGEDVFYQALKSIRTGLIIGTLTTLVMLPFALLLGIMAGFLGGWIDDVIQYLYTTLNSIPGVLLIAAAILMLNIYLRNNADSFPSLTERADLRLLFLCLILGITSWTGLCRYLRAESLKLREIDYVQAAHALGVRKFNIMLRHLLPNVMHIVLITVVLDFSGLVLAEAVLSYVQIGVDPTMNSWGNMINSARLEMAREPIVWWSLAAAFVFMFVLVLAANLFADAVRDAFDPRLRGAA